MRIERGSPEEGKWSLTPEFPSRGLLCPHLCRIINQVLVDQDRLPPGQRNIALLREQPAGFRSWLPVCCLTSGTLCNFSDALIYEGGD